MNNQLYSLRITKGVTQKQVAAYIGCSYQCYQKYENGSREPDFETLFLLADYFETSIDYILGRVTFNTEEEKAVGVGAHGVKLSEAEWDWLELRSEIIRTKGERGLKAITSIIKTYTQEK